MKSVVFAALAVLFSSHVNGPEKQSGKNPVLLEFMAGELRIHDGAGGIRIGKNGIILDSGYWMRMRKLTAEEMASMFPDSTYPAAKEYKNDTCAKTQIALPVGKKRYAIREVEVIACGHQSITMSKSGKNAFISFDMFDRSKAGLVRIKGTDIYFLL